MIATLPSNCKRDFHRSDERRARIAEMEETLTAFLGARLKEVRKARGLTQTQVGGAVDKTHSTVGQWERGETLPELVNLVVVAEFLAASIDYLVWGMGNEFDARVRALPDMLRVPLIERINKEIEDAEGLAKRLPPEFSKPVIEDNDNRLRRWSAGSKIRREKLAPSTKPPKGRHSQ